MSSKALRVGYCRDCKHWCKEPRGPRGTCEMTVFWGGRTGYPGTLATALGGDYCILSTEPNFGCVQFEQKATSDEP
jgi:hypothetical protein